MARKHVSPDQSQQIVNHDDEDNQDDEDHPNASQEHQSISNIAKPRKKRGINKIQDLPVGESVKFNMLGAAIGKHRRKFTTYFGNAVRKNISILISDWHKVKDEDKEMLWLDVKTKMRVEDDDTIKSYTLKSCGNKWRAFKNGLRNQYMLKNIPPFKTYTFLDPDVWDEFRRIEHYSPAKMKLREEAIARAKNQINRPRVGAKGFTGFEEQWEEERNDPNKSTDLHKIPGRGSNFCLGRRRLDKDGNLSGPDHGGRTRGVNSLVGCKKGLKGYVRKKRSYSFEEVSQKMQESIVSGPIWNQLKEKFLEEMRKAPSVGTSSVDNIIRIDSIKEPTTVSLFSPESILIREKTLCAHATLYPVGDGLIHGKRLRKGHVRVSVMRVLNGQEDLELPVPDEDIPNLGGALQAFIQWPVGAIASFAGLQETPSTSAAAKSASHENVQGSECSALSATTVPTVTRASKKRKINTAKAPVKLSKDDEEKAKIRKRLILLKKDVDKRSDGVKKGYYRWMDRKDCAMAQLVDFKKEIFRDAADFTLPINPIDIIEFLEGGEQIGNNIITLFLRSLYLLKEATPNKNNKTGFLNPEVITADTGMDTDINVILYLTEALRGYDFYVAPYLNSRHHALLIICPNHGMGFILDSYNGEAKKTKEDYYLVNLVEGVVGP